MKRKKGGILVVTLFMTSILFSMTMTTTALQRTLSPDIVDQKQELTPELQWLDGEEWQQFQHGGGTLTKVDVHIGHYYGGSYPMTLSIEASLGSPPLTQATLDVSSIPDHKQEWVTFDVVDVDLTAGQKYYLVIRFNLGSEYAWSGASTNPYAKGTSSVGPSWDYAFRTYIIPANDPPSDPSINGASSGNVGQQYTYIFMSTDPEVDDVSYYIQWGDGNEITWTPYQASGSSYTVSHTWATQGTYTIQAKAKDTSGDQSGWSSLQVTMPKEKQARPFPFGTIIAFGFDVDVKLLQLEPGEDYVDLEVLTRPFYIWGQDMETIQSGAFIRLYTARGLFEPSLPFCLGTCEDWGIIG